MRMKDLANAKRVGLIEAIKDHKKLVRSVHVRVLVVNGKARAALVPWHMMIRFVEELEASLK